MSKLYAKIAKVDLWGRAVIPVGTNEIAHITFDGNKALRSVLVPGTVKQIGDRAFADCVNLKKVCLEEGLQTIGRNAFTGCSNLTNLILPDSIRELDGWAFYNFTGLQNPAYNRSRTILYCYPCTAQEKIFRIPEGIKRINSAAFLNNPYLEEVILPESLEILEARVFLDCGIRRITIPDTVKRIEGGAFWGCKFLKEVCISGDHTTVETGAFYKCSNDMQILLPKKLRIDEQLHLRGMTFLRQLRLLPPEDRHWESTEFIKLAKGCVGESQVMWSLGNYLSGLGTHPFYQCAANFWRYRAFQKGDAEAEAWFLQWVDEHPGEAMPSIMDETMSGYFDGKALCGLGFLFFNPERGYSIDSPDSDGVVEVSSWSSTEGPDSDGFGMEECYDWWYLDENLNELPGVGYIHNFSHLDKRNNEKKFQKLHDAAAASVRERRTK